MEAFFRQYLYLFICLVEENIDVLPGSVYVCTDDNGKM